MRAQALPGTTLATFLAVISIKVAVVAKGKGETSLRACARVSCPCITAGEEDGRRFIQQSGTGPNHSGAFLTTKLIVGALHSFRNTSVLVSMTQVPATAEEFSYPVWQMDR